MPSTRTSFRWLVCWWTTVLAWPEASTKAQAGDPTGWLQVDASGDPCIEAEALRAEAQGLLAQDPPDAVRVHARAEAGTWSLVLWHPTGERAERWLSSLPEACDSRRRALGLAIALAVEHAVSAPAGEPAPEPALEPEPEPEPEAEQDGAPLTTAWFGELGFGVSVGDLPQPTPVVAAALMLELGALVGIELRALAGLRAAETNIADGLLLTRNLGATLGPCLGGPALGGRLFGCAQLELAAVLGHGDGLTQDDKDTTVSGAAVLASAMRWPLSGGLHVTGRAELLVRFLRPEYSVVDAGGAVLDTVELPPVGGRLLIGLGWRAE
jgi:hypothetical protein